MFVINNFSFRLIIDLSTDSDAILKILSLNFCGMVKVNSVHRPKLCKNTNFHENNLLSSRFIYSHFQTTWGRVKVNLISYLHIGSKWLLPLESRLIVQILLFGSENYDSTANKIIISSVIEFIIKSKRFEDALIQW